MARFIFNSGNYFKNYLLIIGVIFPYLVIILFIPDLIFKFIFWDVYRPKKWGINFVSTIYMLQ